MQIEADIRPFKGLLLGLFFVSVGASVDMEVLARNWKEVFWILAGLLVVKVSVITGGSSIPRIVIGKVCTQVCNEMVAIE